jgi:hypothetical protein
MPDKVTPRTKRLLVIAIVTPWLFLIVHYGTPQLTSQGRHLRSVEMHIAKIAPQWDKFRAEHPGFQEVKFFAYTDGDGMFGGSGSVETEEQVSQLRKFMESSQPPRPIYLHVDVVGPGFFEFIREHKEVKQGGPATAIQPMRPETNPPPPPTDPHR